MQYQRLIVGLLFLLAQSALGQLYIGQSLYTGQAIPPTYGEATNPPSISVQPQSVTCITNTTVSFTLTAAGTAPLSYQWRTNSVDLADVAGYSGATNSTLWVSNVVIGQSNWAFACVVTNAYGSITSEVATLTVTNSTYGNTWADRVVSNGGSRPSSNTVASIDAFYTGLQNSNVLSKMKDVCCFVPDNLVAATTPLIITYGGNVWTNFNFVAGDLSTNGLAGNRTNKYLNTGIAPSSFSYTNAGVTAYACAGVSDNDGAIWGSSPTAGANGSILQLLPRLGNTLYCDWPIEDSAATRISGANTTLGCFTVTRNAANSVVLYKSNSSIGFTTFGSDSGSCGSTRFSGNSKPLLLFAMNNGGTPAQYYSDTISFVAFHTGLTSGEAQALYNLVQTLRTSLGGGYL